MAKKTPPPPRWDFATLLHFSNKWLKKRRSSKWNWGENSPWWTFIYRWDKKIATYIQAFIDGTYQFSPLQTCHFKDQTVNLWECADRLILHLIHLTIKPLFKHVLLPCSYNLQANGVEKAIHVVHEALKTGSFRYFLRIDVKSFYASINRNILLNQTLKTFQDPRLQYYLSQIITIPIINRGLYANPDKGIPLISSLSPFLGALYLTPLDIAFQNRTGILYVRYCDDIIILAQTKRQFVRAKKILKQLFAELRLEFSRRKTKMGALKDSFHFLGIQFDVAQTTSNKTQVTMGIHPRTCRRARDKAAVMKEDRVHARDVLRYLSKGWATWWRRASGENLSVNLILLAWVSQANKVKHPLVWLGRSMIPLRLLKPYHFSAVRA